MIHISIMTQIKKFRVNFFLVLIMFGCKEEKALYEYLVYRNKNIKIWTNPIVKKWLNSFENGEWTINDKEGNILAQGYFDYGFKKGRWTYHPSDTLSVNIDWKKHENNTTKINYPEEWKVIEASERPFQAAIPTTNENTKDKYFLILSYDKDSISLNLKNYWQEYNKTTINTEEVKEYALFSLITGGNNHFFFSRYIIQRGNEEMLILSFIGETEKNIYDIIFSSLNTEYEKKHIIFFDMLRSLMVEGKRFFSPFDPIIKMKNIDGSDSVTSI